MATRNKSKNIMKSGLVEEPVRKTYKPVLVKARGKYRIVDGTSQFMIEPSSPETRKEE